ncbi:carbon catabolite repression protein CreD, putative [Talaromyces stipitatus ATCC 10500]|uniref:Carbon catabolite repressor D n=1 Tax=Talaromyces stipitatus (strain ATCC 10500 / CBS 375.48 / QM 6759 / NRRL 1006) TaxID=441959 RepID=B8LY82_TALSN|nr:carbon catabolite repression protein CreD, putative [Talaromyces stipitatus ATCC 10500]EED23327.1 carbon catabolite repression protein CreD, putative [Talaromyces stipitatus ATCC 10500]
MEALSFLSGGGIASSAKYFDIRLDDPYVVFRGSEHEAASAHLRGTLVLCLSEPLTIKHLKLTLIGMSRICWHLPSSATTGGRKPYKEKVFYEKEWKFRDAGKGRTEILPADNYEFPFDVILEGSLPESVEGLHDTWVTYRFKAEIGRKYARDIVIRKPVRIVRTLDPSALELAHAMSVENIWPNKIEYSISTPTKAVIFGTSVRIDFRLIPLLKGLKIGTITSQLIETHELTMNPDDPTTVQNTFKSTRTIKTDDYELNEEEQLEILDETAEGFQFHRMLELPHSLSRCLQDTDVKGIKIRHKLKFRVQLHNPDGHTSELRATLPVTVLISPDMRIDENNTLIEDGSTVRQHAAEELANQAPPLYGQHQFDRLYSDIDISGYRTPGPMSGSATPFGALSRNISSEDLPSLEAITNGDISASALHSRLSHLHATRGTYSSSPGGDNHDSHPADYFSHMNGRQSGGNSHSHSPENNSRRASDEQDREQPDSTVPSGMVTPHQPQYMEVETLSRVPSYTTAIRTAARTQYDSELPAYDAAISSSAPPARPLPPPQQAHLRNSSTSSPTRMLTLNDALHRTFYNNQHTSPGHDDAERRLRLTQARVDI